MPSHTKVSNFRNKYYNKGKKIINEAKDRPCLDCGIRLPPEVMDFDHVRGEKLITISQWNVQRKPEGFKTKFDALRAEIEKCDVVCPTCHALRHYKEYPDYAPQGS
jgi:hypothetical protein